MCRSIHLNAFLSYLDLWQVDCLSVGKLDDISLISDSVASIEIGRAHV
jgi:hypothetical protein